MKHKTIVLSGFILACLLLQQSFAQKWDTLFNGKDMTGWRVMGKKADVARNYWTIDNGTILAWSTAGGFDYIWFYSDKEYRDFNLKLKFQSVRGDGCNSGTQIRSRYDTTAMWLDGPQLDIEAPMVGAIWDETRGSGRWLVPLYRPSNFIWSDSASGWNQLEISAIGMQITQKLNGVLVTTYDGAGVLNDAVHKSHNVGEIGHLALQIHGGVIMKIRFKDIYIQDLSQTAAIEPTARTAAQPFSLRQSGNGISITMNKPGFSKAEILDLQGKVLYKTTITGATMNWAGTGNTAHGAYIVKLTGAKETFARQFVLAR
jgi:hypothetical protein